MEAFDDPVAIGVIQAERPAAGSAGIHVKEAWALESLRRRHGDKLDNNGS